MALNVRLDLSALELGETVLALHAARSLEDVVETVLDWGRAHCANARCFGVLLCEDDTLRWRGGWADRMPTFDQAFDVPEQLREARGGSEPSRADFQQASLATCRIGHCNSHCSGRIVARAPVQRRWEFF